MDLWTVNLFCINTQKSLLLLFLLSSTSSVHQTFWIWREKLKRSRVESALTIMPLVPSLFKTFWRISEKQINLYLSHLLIQKVLETFKNFCEYKWWSWKVQILTMARNLSIDINHFILKTNKNNFLYIIFRKHGLSNIQICQELG